MTEERIVYLLERLRNQELTEAERQELIGLSENNSEELLRIISGLMEKESFAAEPIDEMIMQAGIDSVVGIDKTRLADDERPAFIIKRSSFLNKTWFRYAAAILIIAGFGAYLWMSRSAKENAAPIVKATPDIEIDVAPGGDKAMITLADGSTIVLDSAANGALAQQGGARIVKHENGQIEYVYAGGQPGKVYYNTLSTPRGGQYRLALPDGTQVWLNSASSITYPTAFIEDTRTVSITGEAYFEAAKAENQPFRVTVNDMTVEALGTHFNINSYADEISMNTTLLEGAVRVTKGRDKVVLKPGQQSRAFNNKQRLSVVKADIEQVIAWKNGAFHFENKNLKEAMREISRWYDLDIRYEGDTPDIEFGGEIGRDLNLSQVIKGLSVSGLHFRMENEKTLVVTR